ncbi:hypothetical protein [Paenibacillus sp.]|uniref:hypothetical protein n=1 Tax=Paenibacillus sp. TaxID=58172 RepID=UPI0035622448
MQERTWNEWVKLAYRYFSYPILQQGWKLYSKGLIFDCYDEGGMVGGTVGSRAYGNGGSGDAKLVKDGFQTSTCTCQRGASCEHLAALAFLFLEEDLAFDAYKLLMPGGSGWGAKSVVTPAFDERRQVAASEAALAVAQSAAGKAPLKAAAPSPNSNTEDWYRYFESTFPVEHYSNLRAIQGMYDHVTGKLMRLAGADWKPTLRLLYELQVLLFVMQLADQVVANRNRYLGYYDSYAAAESGQEIAERCCNRLVELLGEIDTDEANRLYEDRLQSMADYLAAHAFPAFSGPIPWSYVYTSTWWGLLWRQDRVDREKTRLNRALRSDSLAPKQADQYILASLGFDVHDRQDEAAMRKAEQLNHKSPMLFYPYLHGFAAERQWERMMIWLEWMVPFVPMIRYGAEESYFSLWATVLPHVDAEDRWKRAVMALIPRSMPYYSAYLLQRERFQEWVDIHMALGITPLDLRVSDYKPVETNSKDLLLPWFHHGIERFIAEKNRDSYKKAVRLMKRLESLYRRLKKQDQWERYLSHVSVKYSRLRAFQQELGKLKKEGDA